MQRLAWQQIYVNAMDPKPKRGLDTILYISSNEEIKKQNT